MAKPIIRETHVDEELLLKAEAIVKKYPSISGNLKYDLEIYRKNNKILFELLDQRNLPNDTSGIDKSKYITGETILTVILNPRVEKVLDDLIKLQSDRLDEILGKH